MKFMSRKQKNYFKHIQQYRLLAIQKPNKEKKRKKEVDSLRKKRNKIKQASERINIYLKMPVHVTIITRKIRGKLIKITRRFREFYHRSNICLNLDFSDTKKMYADGTLYFLAELDSLIILNKDISFKIIFSNEKIVNQVLEQTGILNLLNKKMKFEDEEFDDTVKYWNYASGHNSEIDSADSMLDDFDKILASTTSRDVFTVLTEALTNCHQHAYVEKRFPSAPKSIKKWWLFSEIREDKLTVCVCDLGVGIPNSLKVNSPDVQQNWFQVLKDFLAMHKVKNDFDGAAIKAAIEISNTRTNLPNRGKGLNQIINKVNTISDQKVSVAIYSNKGSYIINRGLVTDLEKTGIVDGISIPYKESLEGTLIVWSIPLDKQPNNQDLVVSNE
ncbi:hypothetical protein EA770_07300 [Acinetobacter baumannii]|nr:hypothetical protein EA770_07300 [Acinetobacter baumannii]